MKLEIYKEKEDKPVEEPIKIRLDEDGGGDIDLVVVDDAGDIDHYLLSITKNGKLLLSKNIHHKFGFNLAENGSLIPEVRTHG